MSSPRPRRLAAAITLAALAAMPAAPALADSIAYVKDGDLWLSTPDGARQYRVTTTGGYSTVSQSDGGNLVALHGDRIHTLDQQGTLRYDIRTPASSSFPGTQFRGPFDPVVSPNGVSIAYTWYYTEVSSSPSCNPSTGCQTVYGRQGTGYTHPDRITAFDEDGYRSQSGWVGPSWTTDGGTIISDPAQVGNEQVVVHTPGNGDGSSGGIGRWFSDNSANGLRDVEQSRDTQKLAAVSGAQNEQINFYRAKGGYPTLPEPCYALTGDVGRYQQPSWSPDSTRLAFADDQGIHVLPIPDMSKDCGTPTEAARLVIPGAQHPDWGPADVPPARPNPPVKQPGNAPGPSPAPGPVPGITPGPGVEERPSGSTVTKPKLAVRRTGLRTALRRGLPVTLTGLIPGKVTVRATVGRTTVATGRLTVASSGKGSGTLRFTATARRQLGGRRSVRLSVSTGGARATVTLKR